MSPSHKHHIVPVYKCKELGLTTSYKIGRNEFYFKENMVEVSRLDHAYIHNPMWKGGIWANDPVAWRNAYNKAYQQTPEQKAQQKVYKQTPKYKAQQKAYNDARNETPEHKEYMRVYDKKRRETPEYQAQQKVYQKAYRLRKKLEKEKGTGDLSAFYEK